MDKGVRVRLGVQIDQPGHICVGGCSAGVGVVHGLRMRCGCLSTPC